MIPLRFKEHLANFHVEVFKQSKDFPETEGDTLSLEFVLEQFSINPLVNQKVSWHHIDVLVCILLVILLLIFLRSAFYLFPDLIFEVFLQLGQKVSGCLD